MRVRQGAAHDKQLPIEVTPVVCSVSYLVEEASRILNVFAMEMYSLRGCVRNLKRLYLWSSASGRSRALASLREDREFIRIMPITLTFFKKLQPWLRFSCFADDI